LVTIFATAHNNGYTLRCSSLRLLRSSAFGTFCFVTAFAAWDAKAAPTLAGRKTSYSRTVVRKPGQLIIIFIPPSLAGVKRIL
jgi:hypothetical protein